jgi:predicted pyridoxine 5'-phosphate oxidase superfamily flavin-nucleotide-binding protein
MSKLYSDSHRNLQRRFDSERLADRLEDRLCRDHLTEDDCHFIGRLDMFFLATVDAAGQPSCSYKGGDPGFVRIIDGHTLVFPNYDGNGMFLSMGNLAAHANVGLLFIDFVRPQRLRIHGIARIIEADAITPAYAGAQFAVSVTVQQAFPNCPRYVHSWQKTASSQYVPRAGERTPVPNWKRASWASDVLPATDPAREPEGG